MPIFTGGRALLHLILFALAAASAIVPLASQSRSQALAPAQASQPPLLASDEQIAQFFDRFISTKMKELEIPGGAVFVVRDGRPILAKAYGVSDLASRQPIDVETGLFRAASISKVVPWLLAMQLVEQGRLDLDRDINAYLDFRIPEAFGRPITMRHLMTHSAGFAERFHGAFDPDLETPLGEKLAANIPDRPYAPGTTIAYSNYGAALAGYVVERLHGMPWERIVQTRVLSPLGMRNSTVAQPVPQAMQSSLVSTYQWGSSEPGPFRVTPLAPMGSLTASAGDMGRLLTLLESGSVGGRQIVKPDTLREMMSLQRPLGPGLRDGMGLGLLVGQYRGVRYAGHAGNMNTLATGLEVLPDHGLGYYYVFTSQGAYEGARGVAAELRNAAIAELIAVEAPPVQARGPSTAQDMAGIYLSTRRIFSGPLKFSGLMDTTLVRANPDGTLNIVGGGKDTHWLPAGRDRFVDSETGILLAASRGADGRVTRFASARLYPVGEFERAPQLVNVIPIVAAVSLGVLVLTMLAAPFATLLRRRRLRRAVAFEGPKPAPNVERSRRWARVSFWMVIVTLLAWAAFGIALAVNFETLFTFPAILRILLGLLTMLSAPFAAIIAWDAVLGWTDPTRSWVGRIWAMVIAAAAAGLAWLFYVLDITNFSTNW